MRDAEVAAKIAERAKPIFAGHSPEVQGAVLADLLALWLAGHQTGDSASNAQLRNLLLTAHIEAVRELIPVNEQMLQERVTQ
jgi:hypothetical protein